MDNNNIVAQWMALQTRENSDNIELARVLIPSLPAEELELNLMIAYYGNIWFQYNENYSEFLSEIDKILVGRGISVEPKIRTMNFTYDGGPFFLAKAFEKTIDTYKNRIDEAKLYRKLLFDYHQFWIFGSALSKYQEKTPCLLNYTLDDWRFLLRKYSLTDDLNEFRMSFNDGDGPLGPTPDFIYDLPELTSFKTYCLNEISPKITQLTNLKHIDLEYCFFDLCQTLDLRYFPKLQTLTIELRSCTIQFVGGEQLQEFNWQPKPDSEGKKFLIPESMRNMTALKSLRLEYPNYIGETLPEFQQLTHLYVKWGDDFINSPHFLAFRRCKYLQISCYRDKKLPDTLAHFIDLEELSIWGTSVTELPSFLFDLTKLRKFYFGGDILSQIDRSLFKHLLTNLQQLTISTTRSQKRQIEKMARELGSTCQVVCT
jgi:hypothetical protein